MERRIDHTASYEDMCAFLLERGVDTENFDTCSMKTLRQLYKELSEREVVLYVDPEHPDRVVRFAQTVRVYLSAEGDAYYLCEQQRRYPNGIIHIPPSRAWSISETRCKGEQLSDTVIRGIWEECEIRILPEMINGGDQYASPLDIEKRPSSVYKGIWSYALLWWYRIDLPKLPWRDMTRTVTDNEVEITMAWIPASISRPT